VISRVFSDRLLLISVLKVIVDGLLFAGGLLIIVMDGPLTPFLPMVRSQLSEYTSNHHSSATTTSAASASTDSSQGCF